MNIEQRPVELLLHRTRIQLIDCYSENIAINFLVQKNILSIWNIIKIFHHHHHQQPLIVHC